MDPEAKRLLEETLALAQENNSILRSMKRSIFWSHVMSVLYWILIIGISIGAFYFLQPYVNQVVKMYANASAVLKNFQQ